MVDPPHHRAPSPVEQDRSPGPGRRLAGRPPSRDQDEEAGGTREDILRVALEEFARLGLAGARVDAIAERTRTSKRMIYYHFGSKEGLYLAVLERAYGDIRGAEDRQDLSALPPKEAVRALIEFTFDYDEAHPEFVQLVSIENIHQGAHMRASATLQILNTSVIDVLRTTLARGEAEGVFRGGLDPVDVHMLISSFCFFRVANRHTFGMIFDRDLAEPRTRARHKALIVEAVLRYLAPT